MLAAAEDTPVTKPLSRLVESFTQPKAEQLGRRGLFGRRD